MFLPYVLASIFGSRTVCNETQLNGAFIAAQGNRALLPFVSLFIIERSHATHSTRAAFERLYHCTSTDKLRGACPSYNIGYLMALCARGTDVIESERSNAVERATRVDLLERHMQHRRHQSQAALVAPALVP